MKRTLTSPNSHRGRRVGVIALAASLLAGLGLASPSAAVEPTPTPAVSAATTTATAAATAAPTTTPAPAPAPAAQAPAPTVSPNSAPLAAAAAPTASVGAPAAGTASKDKAAMAAAVGPGGAEMGQRSARVAGPSPSLKTSTQSAAIETLTTQGSWSPSFGVKGLDVSGYQSGVDWPTQWNMGARFAYVKASEGNYFTNDSFSSQYDGSRSVGMIRGAYHFAIPNWSSGADQAQYFVQNGGGWSSDGYTLPPVLDFEYNPYAGRTINGVYFGDTCYGMSPAQLTSWVHDFGNTMLSLTGRLPVIYTNSSWWKQCTGDPGGFSDYPLWVAYYPGSASDYAGPIPSSWDNFSMWQYSSTGPFAGDSNIWNGDYASLQRFATGVPPAATQGIAATAASTTSLGAPASGIVCGQPQGGCYQDYQGGAIIWSPGTGSHASFGPIRTEWAATGFLGGPMGYPTGDVTCGQPQGGCYQDYQGGAIIWSPATGAHTTSGSVRTAWGATGYLTGPLGYPTSEVTCGLTQGGCYQNYQGGAVIWSSGTGSRATYGPIRARWGALNFVDGTMGYPTGDVSCGLPSGGCFQDYQGGAMIWSAGTGAHESTGPIRTAWGKAGSVDGPMGYPTGDLACGQPAGGCYQNYQGGTIAWSGATGAHTATGSVRTAWNASGFLSGPMGYPAGDVTCGLPSGGCYQDYQGGAIIWSAALGAHPTYGPIRARWAAMNFVDGPMGYPIGDVTCGLPSGGCYQDYQGGAIIWSPAAGAHASTGPTRTAWAKTGFLNGPLGYPTGEVTCGLPSGGCYQDYQNGAIIWSPATGGHASAGPIRAAWAKTGFLDGPLGYPTGDVTCGQPSGGCYQDYQNGAIIWSPATGAHPSTGPIRAAWARTGFLTGPLGYPTGDATCGQPAGACYQDYQGGTITWSAAAGAVVKLKTAP